MFEMKPRGDRIRQAGEAPFWVPLAPSGAGRRCRQASSQPPTTRSDAPQLQAPHPLWPAGQVLYQSCFQGPPSTTKGPQPWDIYAYDWKYTQIFPIIWKLARDAPEARQVLLWASPKDRGRQEGRVQASWCQACTTQ